MKNIGEFLLKMLRSKIFKVIMGFFLALILGYFFYSGCN